MPQLGETSQVACLRFDGTGHPVSRPIESEAWGQASKSGPGLRCVVARPVHLVTPTSLSGRFGPADLPPVGGRRYPDGDRRIQEARMDGVTSYDELMAMTQAEREANFDASIIWKLDEVPEQYLPALERQRQRLLAREERLRGQAS
jgi:hypothetical protein